MKKYFVIALLLGFFGQKAMAEPSQMCMDLNTLRVDSDLHAEEFRRKASEAPSYLQYAKKSMRTRDLAQAALERENCISSRGFSNEGPSYNDERLQFLKNSGEEKLSLFKNFFKNQNDDHSDRIITLIERFREEEASEKTKDDFLKGNALNATNGNGSLYQAALGLAGIVGAGLLINKAYETYKAHRENHDQGRLRAASISSLGSYSSYSSSDEKEEN